jgi:3',5'-nucleoside bisphosphate phosphatase
LHIHSSLSACGEDILSPQLILKQAEKNNIDLIAITDHNTLIHSILINRLSKGSRVHTIFGVELTTKEEVHLLGYFPDEECSRKMESKIEEYLPTLENKPSFFGHQIIYDNHEKIVDIDHLLRQNALQIGLDDLVEFIHTIGGIAVPAHINRKYCGLINQIGFLDSQSNFDAVEVSKFYWKKENCKSGDLLEGFPVISGSDSHFLEDIGSFFMETKNIREVKNVTNFNSLKRYLGYIKFERHC